MAHVEYATLSLARAAVDPRGLDPGEWERARRLVTPRARHRFVAVRSVLRAELAHRLGIPSREVAFVYGPDGKPALAPPLDRSGITFSVSHSGELAVLAFSAGAAIGADVERLREVPRGKEVARRVFTEEEKTVLERLQGDAWRDAFFRLWTRREALVKCVGGSVLAASPPASGFAFAEASVPEGYVAAVCAAAGALTLEERPLYSAG